MAELTYYAQRKSVKNGEPQTPANRYGTPVDMEYQYHLFCASSVKNEAGNDMDSVEWGTLEGGAVESKVYRHAVE